MKIKKLSHFNRGGFTIIEMMLVIGLMAILSTVAFVSLSGRKGNAQLSGVAMQMVGLVREMQSKSLSQVNGSTWGVVFDNTTTTAGFFGSFKGTSYTPTTSISYYRLSANIIYVTSTLPAGSKKEIYFSQISGLSSATATIAISLQAPGSPSSTISINSSGAVSF